MQGWHQRQPFIYVQVLYVLSGGPVTNGSHCQSWESSGSSPNSGFLLRSSQYISGQKFTLSCFSQKAIPTPALLFCVHIRLNYKSDNYHHQHHNRHHHCDCHHQLICDSTYQKVPVVGRLNFELQGCKVKISQKNYGTSIHVVCGIFNNNYSFLSCLNNLK